MPDTKKNKITYGFNNVHYAVVTETETENGITVEYASPVRLPGGVSANLSKTITNTAVAADDDPDFATLTDNKGYDGDITLLDVPDSFLTDCLGMKVDGETIVENKDDKPSPFALLFEIKGDALKRRRVFYRCTATNPSVTTQTKGDGTTANNVALTISARPAKDTGDIQRMCSESASSVYTNWYKAVALTTDVGE